MDLGMWEVEIGIATIIFDAILLTEMVVLKPLIFAVIFP